MKKFIYYQSIPSIQEYVLVWQDEPRVFKQSEKSWLYTVAEGLEDTIVFRSIDHELALQDIYHKVDWQQTEHAGTPNMTSERRPERQ